METITMPVISIDINLFWQIINFFILVFVFNKYCKIPIQRILTERKKKITSELCSASLSKEEAKISARQAETALKEARNEAYEILKKAEYRAEEARNEILADARLQKERMLREASEEIMRLKSKARQDLHQEVTSLAVELAEKLMRKNIDEQTATDLIDDFIERVGDEV